MKDKPKFIDYDPAEPSFHASYRGNVRGPSVGPGEYEIDRSLGKKFVSKMVDRVGFTSGANRFHRFLGTSINEQSLKEVKKSE